MFRGLQLFSCNEIDRWRDENLLVAAAALNYLAADLMVRLEAEVAKASWQDLAVTPSRFVARQVAPRVSAAAKPVVQRVVDQANVALAKLVEHRIAWQMQSPEESKGGNDAPNPGIFATATAPVISAAALAAALPALAFTTISTGAFGTERIKTTARNQMRERIRDHVGAVLLAGTEKRPSVLDQLRLAYTAAADHAKGV